jgi:hypothetical protein
MGVIAYIAIAVVILAVVIGVLTIFILRKRNREGIQGETNYRVFFITGAIMTPVGLFFVLLSFAQDYSFVSVIPIFTIGIVYIAIGLGNRAKWKKSA